MAILRLSLAGLKKKKSMAATLSFLVLLAALFLNMGFLLHVSMEQFFSGKFKELNGPDFIAISQNSSYEKNYEAFLREDPRVSLVEKEDIIYMGATENNLNSLRFGALIFNRDTAREIAPMHLIKEDSSIPKASSIYVPKFLEGYGAALGDEYILTYSNVDYSFQIAGFFETIYMGDNSTHLLKYFLPEESFDALYSQTSSAIILSAKVWDAAGSQLETSHQLTEDFLSQTNYYDNMKGIFATASCLSSKDFQLSFLSILNIPMLILISFACIIAIIIWIILYCRVREEIQESMQNIGSLQAMGYTSAQIMLAMVLEFSLPCLTGILAGILGSHGLIPVLTEYSGTIVGLNWKPGAHPGVDFCTALLLFVLMAASVCLGVWKIRSLPPVTALRKGVSTHHFGKNLIPLEKGPGSIHLRLALKNIAGNRKQSFTTIVMIVLGVFTIGISLSLYGLFVSDPSFLYRLTGIELSDIQIQTTPNIDIPRFRKELMEINGIRKTNLSEISIVKVEDVNVSLVISDHLEHMEVLKPYKGHLPVYENEIVLSNALLTEFHKQMGDTVALSSGDITREYYITGVSTTTNMGGRMGILTLDGMRKLRPCYQITQIDVYLEDGTDPEKVISHLHQNFGFSQDLGKGKYAKATEKAQAQIEKLLKDYGVSSVDYAVMYQGKIILSGNSSSYQIKEMTNMKEFLSGQLGLYGSMLKGIITVILMVTFLIIGAILSNTIKTLIKKKKEELGIYKALGFTTKDLVKILALNFTLLAGISAAAGTLLCMTTAPSLLQLLFENAGLSIHGLPVNPLLLVLTSSLVVVFVWILSTVRAYQIKNISVYTLFTE